MRVSWAPPDVSSTRVRMGRRWFVRNASPTAARSFMNHARLASIDIHSVTSLALNAQVSTTCVPWVLMTLTRWPAATRAAPGGDREALRGCHTSFLLPRSRLGSSEGGSAPLPRPPPEPIAPAKPALEAENSCSRESGDYSDRLLPAAEAVVSAIVRSLGRAPAREERRVRLPDLHAERAAGAERIARLLPPHRHREIAVRAGRDRAEHVDLGEELDEVSFLRRARLDEVAVVRGQPGDLEDIQHVVNVELGETVGSDRAHQVGMAAEIEVLSVEHLVNVGVASRAEQVVAARAVRVAAVPDRVVGDREHRPEVGQGGPEPVVGGDVRAMELLGPRGPEALAGVAETPGVEVRDLGPLHGHDAEQLAGTHRPGATGAHRHDEALDQRAGCDLAGQPVVERVIHRDRRARLRVVDDPWLRHRHLLRSVAHRIA